MSHSRDSLCYGAGARVVCIFAKCSKKEEEVTIDYMDYRSPHDHPPSTKGKKSMPFLLRRRFAPPHQNKHGTTETPRRQAHSVSCKLERSMSARVVPARRAAAAAAEAEAEAPPQTQTQPPGLCRAQPTHTASPRFFEIVMVGAPHTPTPPYSVGHFLNRL